MDNNEALNTLAEYLKPLVGKELKYRPTGPTPDEVAYINDNWKYWLKTIFPQHAHGDFAFFHEQFWDYIWAIEKGTSPLPYVAVWSRGFAKSSSAEMAVAMCAARKTRKYCMYVCATQDNANKHVDNIKAMLESSGFSRFYGKAAQRKLSKFGAVKGWRIGHIRTESGFTIDAIGLDKAVRGAKTDEDRPDLIILDDVDSLDDTPKAIDEKVSKLTKTLFPAGSLDVAIIFIQNLIRDDGVAARLVYNKADFLTHKILSGPYPALKEFSYEQTEHGAVILTGEPTWPVVTREICQQFINRNGITAFMAEYQHDVNAGADGLFKHIKFRHCAPNEVPDLVQTVLWVDPAVTDTNKSDSHGIQCDGISEDGTLYRLYSWEDRASPREVLLKAISVGQRYNVAHIGIETDQGGDLWEETYDTLWNEINQGKDAKSLITKIPFTWEKAGMHQGNKVHRATLMLADYETGRMVHVVGTHDVLERALRRFPEKPMDLVDSAGWAWRDLAMAGPVIEYIADRLPRLQPNPRNNTRIFGKQNYKIFDERKSRMVGA